MSLPPDADQGTIEIGGLRELNPALRQLGAAAGNKWCEGRSVLIFALLLNEQQAVRSYPVDLLQIAIGPRQLHSVDARFISQTEIDPIVP